MLIQEVWAVPLTIWFMAVMFSCGGEGGGTIFENFEFLTCFASICLCFSLIGFKVSLIPHVFNNHILIKNFVELTKLKAVSEDRSIKRKTISLGSVADFMDMVPSARNSMRGSANSPKGGGGGMSNSGRVSPFDERFGGGGGERGGGGGRNTSEAGLHMMTAAMDAVADLTEEGREEGGRGDDSPVVRDTSRRNSEC